MEKVVGYAPDYFFFERTITLEQRFQYYDSTVCVGDENVWSFVKYVFRIRTIFYQNVEDHGYRGTKKN